MHIKRDWTLTLNGEQYLAAQGEQFAPMLVKRGLLDTFYESLREVEHLIEPVAAWDVFPIRGFQHGRLVLANGARFGDGPLASVTAGAKQLAVAVCTIGPGVEQRIEAYQKDKQLLRAMLLSDLASWAVDVLRQLLCQHLEQDVARQGLHISAPLSPGESDWSVRDQAVIFSLLDAAQIGVSLNASMVMSPLKSLSVVVGIGDQPLGVEGASNCDFCTMRDRCSYRSARQAMLS